MSFIMIYVSLFGFQVRSACGCGCGSRVMVTIMFHCVCLSVCLSAWLWGGCPSFWFSMASGIQFTIHLSFAFEALYMYGSSFPFPYLFSSPSIKNSAYIFFIFYQGMC